MWGQQHCNLLLVLGATALGSANGIEVSASTLRFDMPVMIVVALSCCPCSLLGPNRSLGGCFVSGLLRGIYCFLILQLASRCVARFNAICSCLSFRLTVITLIVLTLRTARLTVLHTDLLDEEQPYLPKRTSLGSTLRGEQISSHLRKKPIAHPGS